MQTFPIIRDKIKRYFKIPNIKKIAIKKIKFIRNFIKNSRNRNKTRKITKKITF